MEMKKKTSQTATNQKEVEKKKDLSYLGDTAESREVGLRE